MDNVQPPAAPPRPPSHASIGRGRGRGQAPTPSPAGVQLVQTGRAVAGAPVLDSRSSSVLSKVSGVSSIPPPSPAESRAPSVAGNSARTPEDKKAAERAIRAQEKELRKDPLPLGWKVYVSRTTGKPYWHHKDSNETRWTKPGIGPSDENAPPTQPGIPGRGLLQTLDTKLQDASERKRDEEQRAREEQERLKRGEQDRKQEEERQKLLEQEQKREAEEKRKAAYRKKAEEAKNDMDLSNLVMAAAAKENESKAAGSAAHGARSPPEGSRLLSASISAAEAAEQDAARQAKEVRWWEQVEQDARDIARGETQTGADTTAFPILSKMGKTAALMASSAAASRAASAAQSSVVNLGADRSSILSPAPVEIGGADMATPLAGGQTQATLRLAGIRSPSVERRTDSTAGQSSSDGARSLEEAGDFAAAEKMYLASGDSGSQMVADMYLRHRMVDEAVRVVRAGASGQLEAEGLVFDLVQKAVKAEHNTDKAAQLLEKYCGGEHAVQLALERGVFPVALGIATRNRAAMHMIPEIRFAHGDAMLKANKFDEASDLFVRANRHLAAAQLHALLGQWEKAARVAGGHKGGAAKAWVEASRNKLVAAGSVADDLLSHDTSALAWEVQGLTHAQVSFVVSVAGSPGKGHMPALEAGWAESGQASSAQPSLSRQGGALPAHQDQRPAKTLDAQSGPAAQQGADMEAGLEEIRFSSLVPEGDVPNRRSLKEDRSTLDQSAADSALASVSDGRSSSASVRPSTAKRELESILKSKLNVHNIYVDAEWTETEGGDGSSDGHEISKALGAPGNLAGAAKSHLKHLLGQGSHEDEDESRHDASGGPEDELDALKDKVRAYKQRKARRKQGSSLAGEQSPLAGGQSPLAGGQSPGAVLESGSISEQNEDNLTTAETVEANSETVGSTQSTRVEGDTVKSEYDTTIDSCLSVMMGPTKTADYLQDLWMRAATIAMDHVPRRKAEVVTEVTDRLIRLGRDRSAAQLCLTAGYHKEALKIAIQARQWDIGEMVCKERPELSPELTTARTMATDNIEENLVPFAEYVRKGRQQSARKLPLATRIMRTIFGANDVDEDDLDAVLERERLEQARRSRGWCCCVTNSPDEGGQTAKSRDWGVGVDGDGTRVAPKGCLATIVSPFATAMATLMPYYRALRANVVRLRNVYPLLALGQALAMIILCRDDLARCTFDTRSQMRTSEDGLQMKVKVAERNWMLPLLLARILVGNVGIFAMWVFWERQRYYRQLVTSPLLMQLGIFLLVVGNAAFFVHLRDGLRWQFTQVAHGVFEGIYFGCHSVAMALMCLGVKRSWWDLMSLVIVPATEAVYFRAPADFRFVVYLLQTPIAALLAIKLFRCFQDVRLLLVPAFLVLLHLGLSCVLLFVHSAFMVIMRDVMTDFAGCLMLCLCIWMVPSTVEWVEDEELADLQGVGDAETARENLEKIREKHRVPTGYETLYEVNKARQDANRLKELMTGQNPDMFAEALRMYSPDLYEGSISRAGRSRSASVNSSRGFNRQPSAMEQVRTGLVFGAGVQSDHEFASYDSHHNGGPSRLSMSQVSVGSVVSNVSRSTQGIGIPAAPSAVPDGFAIQLDKLPQDGRKFVLKEQLRQEAELVSPMSANRGGTLGPAEAALRRNDSAMSNMSEVASITASSRVTPNGRPRKSPGSSQSNCNQVGRGNPPPPPPPGGPPLSKTGWNSVMINPPSPMADSRASSVISNSSHSGLGVMPLHFAAGADDRDGAVSVASVSSVGSVASSASGMGRGRGRGRSVSSAAATSATTPKPPGIAPPTAPPPSKAASSSADDPTPARGSEPTRQGGSRTSIAIQPSGAGPPLPSGAPMRPRSKPR